MRSLKGRFDLIDWNRFRFWFQISCFVLLVYGGYLGLDLGKHLPTFSCIYNTEARGGACYFSVLQHQMAWPWEKLFSVAALAIKISSSMTGSEFTTLSTPSVSSASSIRTS